MNGKGETVDLEIAGETFFAIPVEDRFVHTNHFLTNIDYDLMLYPNSTGRFNRATELVSQLDELSIASMKGILKDQGNGEAPICRKRFSHPLLTDDTSITVTTIIMDMKKMEFHITRGNPFDNPFTTMPL